MAYRSSIAGDTPGTAITSATPAAELVAQIEATFGAHDNWDFVEEIVISPSIYRVWKNRGSGIGANAAGVDFYVALSYNATTQEYVRVRAFEMWNLSSAGSNPSRMIRPVMGTTTSHAENANGSFGDETTGYALNNSIVPYAELWVSNTGYEFGVNATINSLSIYTKFSTVDYACYVGVFESFVSGEVMPLYMCGTSGNETFHSAYDGGTSREPNKPVGHTTDSVNFYAALSTFSHRSGSIQQGDPYLGGNALPCRVIVRKVAIDYANYGYVRGLLRDALYLEDGSTATRNGDEITVGGVRYVKFRFGHYSLSVGVWINVQAA